MHFELVHHDGSGEYVSTSSPDVGDTVVVRLRVPRSLHPGHVWLRTVADGEPRMVEAKRDARDRHDQWWSADLPIRNPLTHYRWLLEGGDCGYRWFHAAGHSAHDVTDATDFAIAAYPPTPAWAHGSVVYQVLPDRFASSGIGYPLPEWAIPRSWDDLPMGRGRGVSQEYFGGDLWGVIDRLDHLQAIGVTALYLTPFFPAGSTHRYDARSFDEVDPLLGGDEALVALTKAAHARGMAVIGDLTLNHSGAGHDWFVRAKAGDPDTRDFYLFDDELPHGYECWFGVPSLPKFRYESVALRQRLVAGEHSVLRRWLQPPYSLDGWRIDVANMSGRHGAIDLNHDVARLARLAARAEGEDKVLIAEHFHDAGPDLPGDGWQGTMNYAAFMRPVWSWLRDPELDPIVGGPAGIPVYDGQAFVDTMRAFAARMPWRSLCASWNVLDSHDTARIRTVVGSRERHIAALALQMTLPGVPMVFSGDELGMDGRWGEDSRRTYPWRDEATWDRDLLAAYAQLAHLRRSANALAFGGLRWVHVGPDAVAYLRESADDALLVVVARAPGALEIDVEPFGIEGITSVFGYPARLSDGVMRVEVSSAGAGVWRIP